MLILGYVDVPWWLLWPIALVMTVVIYTSYKKSYFWRLGIPSSKTSFFFGDLAILPKKGFFYIDANFVQENGKVCGVYLGNVPQLIIHDTQVIKQIMVKNFSTFPNRAMSIALNPKLNSMITFAKDAHWKYLRLLLAPSFTTGKLRKMEGDVLGCIDRLKKLIDKEAGANVDGVDMTALLDNFTVDVICIVGFGQRVDANDNSDYNDFVKVIQAVLNVELGSNIFVLLSLLIPDLNGWLSYFGLTFGDKKLYDMFKDAVGKMCEERLTSQESRTDLLELMMMAHKDEELGKAEDTPVSLDDYKKRGLNETEIVMNCQAFLTAGYDGVSAALAWLMYDLVLHPQCQEQLIHEIDAEVGQEKPTYDKVSKLQYLDMFMKESSRIHPTTVRVTREAVEDIEIEGLTIKKGLDCTVSLLALHFMPEYWENPHTFNPQRFSAENKAKLDHYAFMPFGFGPRNCIGQRLALLEMKMTIVGLLQRYRFTNWFDTNCIGQRLALLEMKMTIVGLLQRYRFTKTDNLKYCNGQRLGQLEIKMTVVGLLQRYRFTDNLKDPMPHQKKIVLKPADQIVVNVEIRETAL